MDDVVSWEGVLQRRPTTQTPCVMHLKRSVNFKMSFWCLQIFQKTNEIFSRISALASKKRSNQKNLGHFIPLIGGFYFDSLTRLFLIWPLFRGYVRNPGKNFVDFFGDLKTPRGHFEIN